MVDLEIKVVFLDIIVKEGVILFKSDTKGDKLFVIDGSHTTYSRSTMCRMWLWRREIIMCEISFLT
jgi:hypothetical protein